MMYDLEVYLFGKFSVRSRGETLGGLDAQKVQELFSYLVIHSAKSHSREVLAELLWGNRGSVQSRKYLRQTLWQIHSALDPCAETGCSILAVEPDWVQINGDFGLWTDVSVLERAYAQVQGVAGATLDQESARTLHDAVQLYRGDLLEGCYQDWCIFERERLQNIYLAALDKLMDHCEADKNYEAGLAYGARILRLDRARERTHRRMMRLYYLAGDRTTALRQYDQLVRALREELNVKPSRRSAMLCEQIRADSFETMPPPSGGAKLDPRLPKGGALQADPRDRLRYVHSLLTVMQRQIRQDLDAIELALTEL